jgi:ribosomal protein S18 acetylase RimI-like enzyme
MPVRPFAPEDASALTALSAQCARGETDFVLNPLWESEEELFAEFERLGVEPEDHLLVAESGDGRAVGCVGFLRRPGATTGGLLCPIVERNERGRGLGGELLRAGLAHGAGKLGLKLVTAAIGVRNRAGYALLTATGFRPARQYFLMRCTSAPKPPRPSVADIVFGEAPGNEAEAILELYLACGFEARTAEVMRQTLNDGLHAHAVARQEGRIVAFAEIETHWRQRPWVAFVGVDAELRDRGVGSALVAWALAREFEGGARSALLMLSPANRTALRAYEKVAFRRIRLVDVLEKGL